MIITEINNTIKFSCIATYKRSQWNRFQVRKRHFTSGHKTNNLHHITKSGLLQHPVKVKYSIKWYLRHHIVENVWGRSLNITTWSPHPNLVWNNLTLQHKLHPTPSGVNWNAKCKPGLIANISAQPHYNAVVEQIPAVRFHMLLKALPDKWRLLWQHFNTRDFWMRVIFRWPHTLSRCPHIFVGVYANKYMWTPIFIYIYI